MIPPSRTEMGGSSWIDASISSRTSSSASISSLTSFKRPLENPSKISLIGGSMARELRKAMRSRGFAVM